MGKYERYKNKIEMLLSSEKGRRWLTRCYSWGAAVVIVGALCKIIHVPYANHILLIAMTFEACVFFLSGFERPMSDYHWEDVFPVLKSKNPLDRPDFSSGGGAHIEREPVSGGLGGGSIIIGDISGMSPGSGQSGFEAGIGQGGLVAGTSPGGMIAIGNQAGGAFPASQPPTAQERVNIGMAAMGIDLSEKDAGALSESIKKLNSAAEQISKMADLSEVTQSYIDQISAVSGNLEKFSEITGSLGEVSDSIINSCKVISGKAEDGGDQMPASYVENMSKLNDNLSGLNLFYETQLTGIRAQMDTIHHINAGLNRIRDLYDSSIVDSATFRNENERMAQLLAQLNQVYSRMLQAMTINVQGGGYPPPPQPGYPQPPYQGFR
ncbi:MAG: gliding motility protein GldL [Tannerella sp.]|jgi:gliding motility-associated protein GldL|nr:gliding motility protein GldL [Tannerella sp.]